MTNRRGVALMLALWLIVLLGTVTAGVVGTARAEANVVANVRARATARYAAESGVVVAHSRLLAAVGGAVAIPERVRRLRALEAYVADLRDVPLGDARFTVAVADLNARLDLNQADEPTLRGFFLQFVGEPRASELTDVILDWRDADDARRPRGAEIDDYRRARSPYVPANAPFARLEEIRRLRGMTDALASAIAPYVTVQGDARVNINSAPAEVVAALPGIGPAGARVILRRRGAGEVFTSSVIVPDLVGRPGQGAIDAGRTSVVPSRILVISRGWAAGHALTHEIQAVFSVGIGQLQLQAWQERDL